MVNTENKTTQYVMIDDDNLFFNVTKEIIVGENEHLVYNLDQHLARESDTSVGSEHSYKVTYRFICKRNSTLKLTILLSGCSAITYRFEIILQEEGAHATILGCIALNSSAHQIVELVQEHSAPHTTSYSLVHSALTDKAIFKFNGMVAVAQSATGADAALYNKNLLLSNCAQAVAVPSLEVHTNQVQCKHGTATSRYDQKQLLYMQSRGIALAKAQELVVRGFFSHGFDLKHGQLDRVMHTLLQQT